MNTHTMDTTRGLPPAVPGLKLLFLDDFIFGRAVRIGVFALLAGFGIHWASQPQPNAVVKVEHSPLEVVVMQWSIPAGLVIAAIAVLIAVRRRLWIKKVITEGVVITGMVEAVDVSSRTASHSENTPAFQRPVIRTYWASITYSFLGKQRKFRRRLPNSPGTYSLVKGREVELLIHESAPGSPLIHAIYGELPRPGRR